MHICMIVIQTESHTLAVLFPLERICKAMTIKSNK